MSVVASVGAAHTCSFDGIKSKFAPLAIAAVPIRAAHETDPSLLSTSTQRKFLSSKSEDTFAKQLEAVGKQGEPYPSVRQAPPPAPRLRPSPTKAIVPFLALENVDESDEEECQTPQCPAAPRLGSQADPPFASAMPELMLPPSIVSCDSIDWDDTIAFVLNELDDDDSEADGENGSSGANIWNRMVSANASTACADDLEERCQSPGLADDLSVCKKW